ncbi:MAG TPA: amino acid permease [Thioploca sp.]|nr:amino acid permease [Thioploca sp.]
MATPLKRTLSLTQITLYGVGTILGAGIYVLLGEVALVSGSFTPLAFLVAAVVVSFSAYSYRHLARRFPYSAGEAVYVQEAFASTHLSRLVGLTIVFSGIISAATIARGFTGYFAILVSLPDAVMIILLVGSLTVLAAWGVRQSVSVAVATSIVELFGIAVVIWASFDSLPSLLDRPQQYFMPTSLPAWSGIGAGAFIAFYAFIGFEDMVNMAEEVKNSEKNMFRGIVLALIITSSLYVLVALCAVAAVPLEELAGNKAPLALIVERNTRFPVSAMAVISMVAVINGALLQIIMCARVLYGMGKRGMVPVVLARVHEHTQTPIIATLLVGSGVMVFALMLPLITLAKMTSLFILCVFTLVNAALLTLNWRSNQRTLTQLSLPASGALICIAFIILQLWI